jgi:hypothetical protein
LGVGVLDFAPQISGNLQGGGVIVLGVEGPASPVFSGYPDLDAIGEDEEKSLFHTLFTSGERAHQAAIRLQSQAAHGNQGLEQGVFQVCLGVDQLIPLKGL